jgi:hypothetical protein
MKADNTAPQQAKEGGGVLCKSGSASTDFLVNESICIPREFLLPNTCWVWKMQ